MKPRIAILSCATGGGAGIAAKRLADVLAGRDDLSCDFIDATMLGGLPEEAIHDGSATNRMVSDTHFTAEHPGFVRQWLVNLLCGYDVVNFHWATMLVTVSEILEIANRGKKVMLTMHDFFYATGGCHYQAGCRGQARGCTDCPQVDESIFSRHAVSRAFSEKMTLLRHENVIIVSPSHYLADRIRQLTGCFPDKVRVIRNPYPVSDAPGRRFLPKPESAHNKVMVIADSFGERRKNIPLSIDAASAARKKYMKSLELHLVGNPTPEVMDYCRNLDLDIVSHGHVTDPGQLAAIYQTCGILVTCSSDDNWPNVLVEAGVHGTVPVVGPGHGCEEFAREYGLDLVADGYDAESFAKQISRASEWLADPSSEKTITKMIQNITDDHSSEKIGLAYKEITTKLISNSKESKSEQ